MLSTGLAGPRSTDTALTLKLNLSVVGPPILFQQAKPAERLTYRLLLCSLGCVLEKG